jgi:S-adenosylmethionine synthetase
MNYTFTSESVCNGHPDKICDQISDAILDEVITQDPGGRVAVETLAGFDHLTIAGEITTTANINLMSIAKREIRRLGYTNPLFNFSDKSPIDLHVHTQSPEIATGVNQEGAGDQGMMFGFACRETSTLMPLPISIANDLAKQIDTVRERNILSYLYPDGKSQVTVVYKNNKPYKIASVVLAAPHQENISLVQVKNDLYKTVVIPTLHKYGFSIPLSLLIVNGTGVWHCGGPASDTGLTGRKIIVDTYGGYARVGGGAFSGKDPTKVDRSGAYAARYIAKNIVSHNLADKAEIRLAYCIGERNPMMQEVDTFGTEKVSKKVLKAFVAKLIDTSVKGIIDCLRLQRPLYLPTASYGHFGRNEFPWEQIANI